MKNAIGILSSRAIIAQMLLSLEIRRFWWASVVDRVTSNQLNGEDYGFIGGPGQMVEGLGDIEAREPGSFPWFIRNRHFQLACKIKNLEFRHAAREKLERYIQAHTTVAGNHPGVLIKDLVNTAETATCYDGEAFFATSHPVLDATQSNLITKTVVSAAAPTEAEIEMALLEAIARIYTLTDDQGNPVNDGLSAFEVACPAAIWPHVLKVIAKLRLNGGGDSVLANGQSVEVGADGFRFRVRPNLVPGMTGTLFDLYAQTERDGAPFIWQVLEDTEEKFLGLDSEYSTVNGHVLAVLRRSYNMAFGRYQRAVRTKLTE